MSSNKGKAPINPETSLSASDDGSGGFPVIPRKDCPHVKEGIEEDWTRVPVDAFAPCAQCSETEENWRCLGCQEVLCSRYRNAHMAEHAQGSGHPLAISHADLSTWCAQCEDYITDPFGEFPPDQRKAD
ncbi:hypothetical protein BJ684DRAFT_20432 [Piptocephalis cylindrospora]|uniref:UBP-type domain-containing protein n=1 Tax=Piptocephalis cylindrospora TaxID=1907219 RepID=A0A4P9Y2D8_9FUNG|nr:hypothetical protein BJ684DRAFT_20432 [Piptocephalis cylindrospora]|eukprot:RKP13056.1 hypothetical protein BJ684DRAFT_20432 [Piptocephalis cylindrospora]